MISVIIPSYKDPYLNKTIESIISSFRGEFEIIPVYDGYIPKEPINQDIRIRPIHLVENVGMREAINTGVRYSVGKYIMRTDEHCMFSPGFDIRITECIAPNWIVTPRRYALDPVKWEVMPIPPIDYEKLKIVNYGRGMKFSGVKWDRPNMEHIRIDETMAMQGSCWIMYRSWWDDVIGELQTFGYDTHYQDSHEMVFKTWKAGGKLMVNKDAWYAHKHRSFPRTHGYGGEKADKCFAYALEQWKDYYENEVKKSWGM